MPQQGGAGGGEYTGEEVTSAAPRSMALRWESKTLIFPEPEGKAEPPGPCFLNPASHSPWL